MHSDFALLVIKKNSYYSADPTSSGSTKTTMVSSNNPWQGFTTTYSKNFLQHELKLSSHLFLVSEAEKEDEYTSG